MTLDQQRIAIATKVLPQWTDIQDATDKWFALIDGKWVIVPNYPADLNAMHEAEKVLDVDIYANDSNRYTYSKYIYALCKDTQQPFRASAAIRAEAFCRTFWPERWEK